MIYVGIDIAKLNHFASAISSDGEELIKPFKFTNDNDGFQLLISKLDPLDKDSLIIGLESTAHYGDNLVRYLVAKNYKVCVLNPIKTSIVIGFLEQIRKNLMELVALLNKKHTEQLIHLVFIPCRLACGGRNPYRTVPHSRRFL